MLYWSTGHLNIYWKTYRNIIISMELLLEYCIKNREIIWKNWFDVFSIFPQRKKISDVSVCSVLWSSGNHERMFKCLGEKTVRCWHVCQNLPFLRSTGHLNIYWKTYRNIIISMELLLEYCIKNREIIWKNWFDVFSIFPQRKKISDVSVCSVLWSSGNHERMFKCLGGKTVRCWHVFHSYGLLVT